MSQQPQHVLPRRCGEAHCRRCHAPAGTIRAQCRSHDVPRHAAALGAAPARPSHVLDLVELCNCPRSPRS
eukprot:4829159-Alexandrium_andersonii.AAC.1